jgi:hypothetical protein
MSEPFALGTFSRDGGRLAGVVVGEQVHDLRPVLGDHVTTRAARGLGRELRAPERACGRRPPRRHAVSELRVEVPIDPPGQVRCAGANSRRHLTQMHFAFERRKGNDLSDDELRAASAADHPAPLVARMLAQ